jgi:hypothetical protein
MSAVPPPITVVTAIGAVNVHPVASVADRA